jgi:hypothetical protein
MDPKTLKTKIKPDFEFGEILFLNNNKHSKVRKFNIFDFIVFINNFFFCKI